MWWVKVNLLCWYLCIGRFSKVSKTYLYHQLVVSYDNFTRASSQNVNRLSNFANPLLNFFIKVQCKWNNWAIRKSEHWNHNTLSHPGWYYILNSRNFCEKWSDFRWERYIFLEPGPEINKIDERIHAQIGTRDLVKIIA